MEQKFAEMYGDMDATTGELNVNFKIGLAPQIGRATTWARIMLGDFGAVMDLYSDDALPTVTEFGQEFFAGTPFNNTTDCLAPIYTGSDPFDNFKDAIYTHLTECYQRNLDAMRTIESEWKAEELMSQWATLPAGYRLPDSFDADAGVIVLPEDYVMTKFQGVARVCTNEIICVDFVTAQYIPASQANPVNPASFRPLGGTQTSISGGMFGYPANCGRDRAANEEWAIIWTSQGTWKSMTHLFYRLPRRGFIPEMDTPHPYAVLQQRYNMSYSQYLRLYAAGWFRTVADSEESDPPFVYHDSEVIWGDDGGWGQRRALSMEFAGGVSVFYPGGCYVRVPFYSETFGLDTGRRKQRKLPAFSWIPGAAVTVLLGGFLPSLFPAFIAGSLSAGKKNR